MWIAERLRAELCPDTSYTKLVKLAETSSYEERIDVNDDMFTAPDSMKSAMDRYLFGHGKELPAEPADYFRCAYNSLAYCYGQAVADIEHNTLTPYNSLYIIGGGAKNGFLNSLTEKYTGKKVIALPIEGTAIGNLKIQINRR